MGFTIPLCTEVYRYVVVTSTGQQSK